jgi:hypothetical protein
MLKVLGETFSIKERHKVYLSQSLLFERTFGVPGDGLMIRKYIRVLSECDIEETYNLSH